MHCELKNIGISEELLRKDLGKGSYSPLVGTYRILLHRTLLKPDEKIPDRCKSKSQEIKSSRVWPTSTGKDQNFQTSVTPKSKMCNLL